ncbi:hypothetical protein B0H65DRAFT_76888 [Neurospora tetraspora]|uniref:Uncharacterized protein n=1 Tax=Neurospora tetraspora TaxID=94610 RepID=A0AAE0MJB3_9PEZI|nr:hypothetical protein B0H65DRAFT_76888 [Neurospora tetraspora]
MVMFGVSGIKSVRRNGDKSSVWVRLWRVQVVITNSPVKEKKKERKGEYKSSSRGISDLDRVAARQDDTLSCQGRGRFGRESVVRRIVNTGNVGLGRSDSTSVLTAMETAEDPLAAVKKNGKKGSWSRVRGGRRRIWSLMSTRTARYTTTYNEDMCHLPPGVFVLLPSLCSIRSGRATRKLPYDADLRTELSRAPRWPGDL